MNKDYSLANRPGDLGQTVLIDSTTTKGSLRVCTYGEVDELNCFVGWVKTASLNRPMINGQLIKIQRDLFVIGSQLATTRIENTKFKIEKSSIKRLEEEIKAMETDLPELRRFILPGGCELSSRLHIARGICRRTERAVNKLNETEEIDEKIKTYLNRLSDWFFIAARIENFASKTLETQWEPEKQA